jgi:hypothetical protein
MNAKARKQIIEQFCRDMDQPLIEMALHRSFRRWAELRDQLAADYESRTGISARELLSAYITHDFRNIQRSW